jgi:beta-N-acetylhexosaminidase
MPSAAGLFGVGIGGPALAEEERRLLERHPPWAVVLFRRNLPTAESVAALVAELKRLPGPPLLCVDQEGGPVDRFRGFLGSTVSFRDAARAGVALRAGQLAGRACRRLGFDVDFAPVVDRELPGASERVLAGRCAGSEPGEVVNAALEFLAGLHGEGIGGCVKHFPGLGRADLDTHQMLPLLPDDPEEEARDLAPFAATMEVAGAVMVSHAAGPEGLPASLSPLRIRHLLRRSLGFHGAVFSDDLEMGALSAFGDLPDRCVEAMRAGCDLLNVCSRIDEYAGCVEAVERDVPQERLDEAASRLAEYRGRLAKLAQPDDSHLPPLPRGEGEGGEGWLDDLRAEIRALREEAASA